MINVVIDTNIFISAVLSPKGNPAKVIEYITDHEDLHVFFTAEIFDEYERVLSYKRLKIDIKMKIHTLNLIKEIGILIEPPTSTIPLHDETDRTFYDTTQAAAAFLITGNIKHYPIDPFIMLPADFIMMISENK